MSPIHAPCLCAHHTLPPMSPIHAPCLCAHHTLPPMSSIHAPCLCAHHTLPPMSSIHAPCLCAPSRDMVPASPAGKMCPVQSTMRVRPCALTNGARCSILPACVPALSSNQHHSAASLHVLALRTRSCASSSMALRCWCGYSARSSPSCGSTAWCCGERVCLACVSSAARAACAGSSAKAEKKP